MFFFFWKKTNKKAQIDNTWKIITLSLIWMILNQYARDHLRSLLWVWYSGVCFCERGRKGHTTRSPIVDSSWFESHVFPYTVPFFNLGLGHQEFVRRDIDSVLYSLEFITFAFHKSRFNLDIVLVESSRWLDLLHCLARARWPLHFYPRCIHSYLLIESSYLESKGKAIASKIARGWYREYDNSISN